MPAPASLASSARSFVRRYGEPVVLRNYELGAADAYGDEQRRETAGSPHGDLRAVVDYGRGGSSGRDAGSTNEEHDAVVYLPSDAAGVDGARGLEADRPPSVIEMVAGDGRGRGGGGGSVEGARYGHHLWGGALYRSVGTGERLRVERVLYEDDGLAALGVVAP
jgi:hypothetical protein